VPDRLECIVVSKALYKFPYLVTVSLVLVFLMSRVYQLLLIAYDLCRSLFLLLMISPGPTKPNLQEDGNWAAMEKSSF